MRTSILNLVFGVASLTFLGCSLLPPPVESPLRRPATTRPPTVVQAGFTSADSRNSDPLSAPTPASEELVDHGTSAPAAGLADLITLTLERNPRLAQVTWAVEAARGRAVQAGLYPNPTMNIMGDELGDRTGPGGIWTTPYVSQEIVTGDKLLLSRSAALKEVDQATLDLIAERYRIFTEVRQNYFEFVTLRRRVVILEGLIGLAEKSVENANKLLKAKEVATLDVVQLEVDLERYRADLDATRQTLPAARRRLAASVGVPDLPEISNVDSLDAPAPDYLLNPVRNYVLGVHPQIRSAQIGVEKAQFLLRRAEVEPIPNLTLSAGYTRQNQNKSNDWDIGLGLPVPVWNRNQGNVFAARAQLGEAVSKVGAVTNDIDGLLATAFGAYASAKQRAERYRTFILPKSEESFQLSLKAYQGGQFEYLRVLQAQQAVAQARLEYLRSLSEMWKAASEIAGLTLEDQWPPATAPAPEPPAPERKLP